jgi:protein-S-isoprenylcysteine O-methyltransferase Ste14
MVEKPSYFKSITFVLIQFISLAGIILTGPLLASRPVLLLIELLGIGLGVWAVLTMRLGHFNITPDPLKWSKLVDRGPYEWIRHPMYLALIVTTLPLVIEQFTITRILIWLILLIGLIMKLNYEEGLLLNRLEGYQDYRAQSWKLIPFLY